MSRPAVSLVDDHLLLRVLLGNAPRLLRGRHISTTGLWYHRLSRAVGASSVTGALSKELPRAQPGLRARAIASVVDLPEEIGLLSLRDLAWPMAQLLDAGVRLNLLSLEALAAAERLGAELCLAAADENPTLLGAAAARRVTVRII